MSTVVFLGPTMPVNEARTIVDAEFLAPAKMGDVRAVMAGNPSTICIIDGVFERVPSVWHKEILFALSRGVRVIGASSMGALRASELHTFGMEGVGAVFEAYRDGLVEDDDEVAVTHATGEDHYRCISEPLINIRFALRDAERLGLLLGRTAEHLLDIARRPFYPERSWPRLIEDARNCGVEDGDLQRLSDFVKATRPNVKRDDARKALAHAATPAAPAAAPSFDFEPTVFWERLVATTSRAAGESGGVSVSEVAQHAMLALDDIEEVWLRAMLSELAFSEGDRLGLDPSPGDIGGMAEAFRRRRGMLRGDATRAWLREQDLTLEQFTDCMRAETILAKLLVHFRPVLLGKNGLVGELKRQGRYAELSSTVARMHAARARAAEDDARVDEATLLSWYQSRFRPFDGSIDSHALQRGFASRREFLRALLVTYLFEGGTPPTDVA